MTKKLPYQILAFYHLAPIDDPHAEVKRHKKFCKERDIKSRIYISEEGINAQMSASNKAAQEYMQWMEESPHFKGITYKLDPYPEHAFQKLTIKYRSQLVAFDVPVDLNNRGEHLSPDKWREKLEDGQEKVVVDVRNDYEWEVGRFDQAEKPNCDTFRDFHQYAKDLKSKIDPKKTPVMMYCTGGIRCEIYSAYLKEKGFENVYQLDGGVINYGHKEGSKHWEGKLFVFDDRLTTPISEEEAPPTGKCHQCDTTAELYYNCANMDCNKLFLSCSSCLEKLQGCCQESCQTAPRTRPYAHQQPHKPFRKWYHYFKSLDSSKDKKSDSYS